MLTLSAIECNHIVRENSHIGVKSHYQNQPERKKRKLITSSTIEDDDVSIDAYEKDFLHKTNTEISYYDYDSINKNVKAMISHIVNVKFKDVMKQQEKNTGLGGAAEERNSNLSPCPGIKTYTDMNFFI